MLHPSAQTEDLLDSIPIPCQKVIEFRGYPDLTHFQTAMAFVGTVGGTPIAAVQRRFGKKEREVFMQGALIALDEQQIISACTFGVLAKPTLGVQCIRRDDASSQEDWREKLLLMG